MMPLVAISMPSWPELLVILLIVVFVFGADRITQVFGAFGRGIKSFRDAQKDGEADAEAKRLTEEANVAEAQEVKKKAGE